MKFPRHLFLSTCLGTFLLSAQAVASPLLATSQEDSQATAQELSPARAAILAIGERFANFRWRATEANVHHGKDANGVHVDTPDVSFDPNGWHPDGRENIGMPYAWGGFTSLEDFESGLRKNLFAGHVPTTERAWSSRSSLGVDCSGFVSHCWNLPQKQSTRSLGTLSYELPGYDALQPGDILNKFDSHVVLFKRFDDAERTKLRVIEAARLRVEENVYTRDQLQRNGFVPMRYKPLDRRWVSMTKEALGEEELSSETDDPPRFVAEGEIELSELRSPLREATPLGWARYASNEEPGAVVTWMIARRSEADAAAQRLLQVRGKELASGRRWDRNAALVDALLDFANFSNPHRNMRVLTSLVETGSVTIGGKELPAHRISAVVEGSLLIRSKHFPFAVELECILADEVPVLGVVDARFDTTTTWDTDESGEPVVSHNSKRYSLRATGTAAELVGAR